MHATLSAMSAIPKIYLALIFMVFFVGPTEMSQPMNSAPVLTSEDFNLVQLVESDADPHTLSDHTGKG